MRTRPSASGGARPCRHPGGRDRPRRNRGPCRVPPACEDGRMDPAARHPPRAARRRGADSRAARRGLRRSRTAPSTRSRPGSWTGCVPSEDVLDALTLVAELHGEVVGHVVCSRATMGEGRSIGLGPHRRASRPPGRGHRLGARRGGARHRRPAHEPSVVLLGDPGWYAHFGFETAAGHGVGSPGPWPDAYFQVKRRRLESRARRRSATRRRSTSRTRAPQPARSARASGGAPPTGGPRRRFGAAPTSR